MTKRKFSLRLIQGGASGKTERTPTLAAITRAPQAKEAPEHFVVPATLLSPAEADDARKQILDYNVKGLSVREHIALAEIAVTTGEGGLSSPVDNYFEALRALDSIGIVLSTGGTSLGLATMMYATVLEKKKLVRHIPALKKMSAKLPGLALY